MRTSDKKTQRKQRRAERHTPKRSGRIWRFEQLESRAMLSANMGSMMDAPIQMFVVQGYHESHIAHADLSAPQEIGPQMAMLAAWSDWNSELMRGGRQLEHSMLSGHGPGQDMWDLGSAPLQHSSLTSPNKPVEQYAPAQMMPGNVEYVFIQGPTVVIKQTSNATSIQPTNPIQNGQVRSEPSPGGPISFDNGSPWLRANEVPAKPTPPAQPSVAAVYNGGPIVASMLGQAASASHEIEVSNLISSGALDAALQANASPLLIASGTSSNQSSITTAINDFGNGELTDDFIRLNDLSATDDCVTSADALSREQAALEEVLKSLQGLDSLPDQTDAPAVADDGSTSAEQDALAKDLAFATAFDLANTDGGMLLLQARGDANESPINLAHVAESHPDMFNAHVGVEVSIGIYQAVDRGIEEFSAAETPAVSNPIATPAKAAKPDNRVTTGRESSGRKAATLVTASTIAGAILWCVANKRADEDSDAKSHSSDYLSR